MPTWLKLISHFTTYEGVAYIWRNTISLDREITCKFLESVMFDLCSHILPPATGGFKKFVSCYLWRQTCSPASAKECFKSSWHLVYNVILIKCRGKGSWPLTNYVIPRNILTTSRNLHFFYNFRRRCPSLSNVIQISFTLD